MSRPVQVAAAALNNKPHLWLRMADCCMGVLQPQTDGAQLHSEHSSLASYIGANTSVLLAVTCSVTVAFATLARITTYAMHAVPAIRAACTSGCSGTRLCWSDARIVTQRPPVITCFVFEAAAVLPLVLVACTQLVQVNVAVRTYQPCQLP